MSKKISLYETDDNMRKRRASEKRFRFYGLSAIIAGIVLVFILISNITYSGANPFSGGNAFRQAQIEMEISLDKATVEKAEGSVLKTGEYKKMISGSLAALLEEHGIESALKAKEQTGIFSDRSGGQLRDYALANIDELVGSVEFTFFASSRVDGYLKGRVTRESIVNDKNITAEQLDFVDQLVEAGLLKLRFNWNFIFGVDASETSPEAAGFGASMMGSLAMMLVVMLLSVPIGVAASIYLEEFAPKNRITDLIEVNIANLAAVPSIVFGILGLAFFLNLLGPLSDSDWLRNNAPFVGGLVLSLMTLPRIVIPTRAALKAVPPSIRDAALGVGASKMQTIFHHVLPLAMPGILTGAIIGLAQALGETAPLLLVGLVGFIGTSIPENIDAFFGGPNTVMPAQIYSWATRADPAWYEKAWGGIIILLVFLISMNAIAIILRRRFERRW